MPDEKTRRRIFQIHTKKMTLAEDLDLEEYITAKDDLSGADIKVKWSKEFLHPNKSRISKFISQQPYRTAFNLYCTNPLKQECIDVL